jgi:hypothetical protein
VRIKDGCTFTKMEDGAWTRTCNPCGHLFSRQAAFQFAYRP